MKAIEMFAGIGGVHVGLARAGIGVVWANDIDPRACAVYRSHFGQESIICGDVKEAKLSIPQHELLTAGFPCQPFSAAGKKLGVHDEVRGTLFAEIVEVLERVQPDFFILENVKRLLSMEHGRHFRTILLALTGAGYFVEWRLLNAKNFGLAQNRERVFIVGRKNTNDLLSRETSAFFKLSSVLLLEGELPIQDNLFSSSMVSDLLEPVGEKCKFGPAGFAYANEAYSLFPTGFPDQSPPQLLRDVLEDATDPCFDFTEATNGWVQKNTEVNAFINGVEILSNQDGGRRMGYTIFGTGGLAPTLTATTSRHYERYRVGDRYRRLTNVEYAKLQGFGRDWCGLACVYDQYSLYGNAVPPIMIEWIATRLLKRAVEPPDNDQPAEGHVAAVSSAS
ncbi:MAG TPA: DNA cytosine methyltransferase [Candidatus Acidoferrales bacterium]|jgi:DNA (cytosine-5)-methyltransferase 1|nr:DNA cytosine methyltransferase [Candidatus Acidoferrales bacterium]